MHHINYRSILLVGLAVVMLIAGGWWLRARAAGGTIATRPDSIEATGVIEARQVALASDIGGTVVEVLAEEGQWVEANLPLIRLEDSLLHKQRDQAQAGLDAAQASLRMLEAGATPDQIKAAQAQLSQAEANLRLAQAALDNASAGTRPEDIAANLVQLDQARARYHGLTSPLTNDQLDELEYALTQAKNNLAKAARRRDTMNKDTSAPDYVLAFAEAAVADAESTVDAAQGAYDAAQDATMPDHRRIELARTASQLAESNEAQARARLNGLRSDPTVPTEAVDDAEATLEDTGLLADATQTAYDALTSGAPISRLEAAWDEVQQAQAQLASAVRTGGGSAETLLAQVDAATAQHHLAAANLSALESGARDEEIEAARAGVEAARAQLGAISIQLGKMTLTAPWDGVVLNRSAEAGEIALPGATLIEVGRLDQLELTVYLPEENFGLVAPGQAVQVRVDAYPGRVFEGAVLRMADEAEFTPTNVQTKEDRTRLVYEVVISLENPELALKPGMIADVVFVAEERK